MVHRSMCGGGVRQQLGCRTTWLRRSMRGAALALILAGPLGAEAAAQTASAAPLDAVRPVAITAKPIASFRPSEPGRRMFGRLEFRGGLLLTGDNSSFGGWSGLTIDPDGRKFLAVSDEGKWLAAEIVYRGAAPSAIANARMGPIVALRGRALDKKRDLDAEALSPLTGTLANGTVLVGFERNHRIGIFPVSGGILGPPTQYLKLPAEARRMRTNKGFESVVALTAGPLKGSVLAFAERYPGDSSRHTGWIWVKGEPHRLSLLDIGEFEVTDLAALPGGDVLVLERRFRWTEGVRMRLRLIAADAIKPAATLQGETLLEADLTSEIDNMEGLTVHRGAAGETVLTLVSDNNFNTFLQRNLLLQFTLHDAPKAAGTR